MQSSLGRFELAVLCVVVELRGDGYGVPIRQAVSERLGRDVSIGALYTTLARLEAKRLVSSNLGAATPERGGRAKRFFKATSDGVRAAEQADTAPRRLWFQQPVEGGT